MAAHERLVNSLSAALFLVTALVVARFVPSERETNLVLILGLGLAYSLVSRVRFEFEDSWVSPEQLVFVAMLVLLPLPTVPLIAAAAGVVAAVPDLTSGRWHYERWLTAISDSWFAIGPVLVLAVLAPDRAGLSEAPIFALAFAAQLACDLTWSLIRTKALFGYRVTDVLRTSIQTAEVDAVLAPLGFVVAVVAVDHPVTLLALAPLIWLLELFSRDRTARYSATLELNRAYRGTVMLLSDVIEFDDAYTGDHSRSVVDLVRAVAEELNVHSESRQELEFAALLHDVGKISIPKEILNKPAALSREEFEVMQTHTIEGQFMLDRIGGLLGRVGEIVRSCHERWDGKGYPDGLAGEAIPLSARIVFACDAYNAMTTDRVYRAAMSQEEAFAELVHNAGSQFEPQVVEALLNVATRLVQTTSPTAEIGALLSASRQTQLAERGT